MKKKILALALAGVLVVGALTGCGSSKSESSEKKTDDKKITVAASATPHAEILEEAKTPGTYPTKINVARTGEGHFVQVGKTTAEATQFINSIVCHRCQVMNISTKADKSLLDQYIVTYWYIDGEAKIYNEIYNRVKSENS